MQPSQWLIYLGLLVAFSPVGLSDITAPKSSGGTENSEQCPTCEFREQSKLLRLQAIKSQILSKLRLRQAPNISREMIKQLLPKAPPLQELLDRYDVLADDSNDGLIDEDDEHVTTESIIALATERKWDTSSCAADSSVRANFEQHRCHFIREIWLFYFFVI